MMRKWILRVWKEVLGSGLLMPAIGILSLGEIEIALKR